MQLRRTQGYGELVASLVPLFERLSLRKSTHTKYSQLLTHYRRFCSDTGRDPNGSISETRLCALRGGNLFLLAKVSQQLGKLPQRTQLVAQGWHI